MFIIDTLKSSIDRQETADIDRVFVQRSSDAWAFFHSPGKKHYDVIRDVEGLSISQVAITHLQRLANKHLEKHAAPRLLLPEKFEPGKKAFLRPSLYLNPLSLAGVCWIQIAQAVSQSDDLVRCVECGTWFSRNVRNGKDKMYCSGACRTRAARKRARV
ncbi:hypothetical protein [Deinococcus navajonensis]|uniref:CGNR zinc finger protein n=1 Tax=Deinococcus navajonensis TaxID=309884 RepID=A0ABV8XMZ3_9DEIO